MRTAQCTKAANLPYRTADWGLSTCANIPDTAMEHGIHFRRQQSRSYQGPEETLQRLQTPRPTGSARLSGPYRIHRTLRCLFPPSGHDTSPKSGTGSHHVSAQTAICVRAARRLSGMRPHFMPTNLEDKAVGKGAGRLIIMLKCPRPGELQCIWFLQITSLCLQSRRQPEIAKRPARRARALGVFSLRTMYRRDDVSLVLLVCGALSCGSSQLQVDGTSKPV